MSNKLVSILMPVQNAEPFIIECIQSIQDQTYANFELIMVNDHSTDKTNELLKQIATSDNRITVVQNSGRGIIDALKSAFHLSQGDYITRMDADDIMATQKVEAMVSDLDKHGAGHIAIGQVRYFPNEYVQTGYRKYEEWLNKLTESGLNFSDIYKECTIPSPCWMLHRSDLVRCGAFDHEIYPEDYDLAFRFYQSGLNVIPSTTILHHWRDHDDRTSRNDERYADNTFLPVKLKYFQAIEFDVSKALILWGAGKKGKFISNWLSKQSIPHKWLSNNHKKIGHQIGQVTVESESLHEIRDDQIHIIAIANEEEQLAVTQRLSKGGGSTWPIIFSILLSNQFHRPTFFHSEDWVFVRNLYKPDNWANCVIAKYSGAFRIEILRPLNK